MEIELLINRYLESRGRVMLKFPQMEIMCIHLGSGQVHPAYVSGTREMLSGKFLRGMIMCQPLVIA